MTQRDVLLVAAAVATVVAAAVAVTALGAVDADTLGHIFKNDRDGGQGEPDNTPDGFVHKHASLFFLVDGERKPMTDAYIERDPHAHFHHDDGIIHIEGSDANLSTVMQTLNVTVNENCVTYGLDGETYCADGGNELRFIVNNEALTHEKWLNHTVAQGDNILLYHGNADEEIPDEYFEPLPEGYAPGFDRL